MMREMTRGYSWHEATEGRFVLLSQDGLVHNPNGWTDNCCWQRGKMLQYRAVRAYISHDADTYVTCLRCASRQSVRFTLLGEDVSL
jgi:hypothetical protein